MYILIIQSGNQLHLLKINHNCQIFQNTVKATDVITIIFFNSDMEPGGLLDSMLIIRKRTIDYTVII